MSHKYLNVQCQFAPVVYRAVELHYRTPKIVRERGRQLSRSFIKKCCTLILYQSIDDDLLTKDPVKGTVMIINNRPRILKLTEECTY